MADDEQPRHTGGRMRRRPWLVAGAVGATVVLAALVFVLSSRTSGHEAVAEVTTAGPGLDDGSRSVPQGQEQRRMATEEYYVESAPVAQRVEELLGDDFAQITDVDAEAVEDAGVVRITVSATSPETARRGADTYAAAYVQQRRSQFQAATTRQIDDLEDQIERGTTRLGEIDDSLAATADPAIVQGLTIEQTTLSATLAEQRARLIELHYESERLGASVSVLPSAS